MKLNLYFSDVFQVDEELLEDYGAFNVSLVTDLPLFVDPFLLFHSKNSEYQKLHEEIVKYLGFLRDRSAGELEDGLLQSWYFFSEVKQNWLGFCKKANSGRGLGNGFARSLKESLGKLFRDFGTEKVTKGSHLEKLCLIKEGVGRDTISDFTTNLIKKFLLNYTQTFALDNISPKLLKTITVRKVSFNYETETWEAERFQLPFYRNDFVILTPMDILSKDDMWISRQDLLSNFESIPNAIPNTQLRAEINHYFKSVLPRVPKAKDRENAVQKVLQKFPQIIDYYIRDREDKGDEALERSIEDINESCDKYVQQFRKLSACLLRNTDFYRLVVNTAEETRKRILFLKDVIENKGGHKVFYQKGKPFRKEEDLHILFRLTWYASPSDVSREVNDGRGPVDFKVSQGSSDKTLVEFKLASNSQLERNLENQAEIYQKASDAPIAFKVIVFFTKEEHLRVKKVLKTLRLDKSDSVYLIDARKDNKPSGSKA